MNIRNICEHHLVLLVGYAMQFPTPTPHLLHWYHTSITPTSLRSPRSAVKSWLKLRQWLHQDTYWLKPMIAYCLVFAGSVWLKVPSCLDVSQTLSTSNKPQSPNTQVPFLRTTCFFHSPGLPVVCWWLWWWLWLWWWWWWWWWWYHILHFDLLAGSLEKGSKVAQTQFCRTWSQLGVSMFSWVITYIYHICIPWTWTYNKL